MSAHHYTTHTAAPQTTAQARCIRLCTFFIQTKCWCWAVILHRHYSLHSLTLFRKNIPQGRPSAEDARRWGTGSCSQLGLSIAEMRYSKMNECWQEELFFTPLGQWRAWTGQVADKKRAKRVERKKESSYWSDPTLVKATLWQAACVAMVTSRLCVIPFLHFPFFSHPDILAFERQRKDTKAG